MSEMRLTCSASFLRSAEGPQRLRGLFAAYGTSETPVFYGRQHENIEHVAPALFEMRQAFDIEAQRTGRARLWTSHFLLRVLRCVRPCHCYGGCKRGFFGPPPSRGFRPQGFL